MLGGRGGGVAQEEIYCMKRGGAHLTKCKERDHFERVKNHYSGGKRCGHLKDTGTKRVRGQRGNWPGRGGAASLIRE